jgi:hypothetical protein
MVVGNKCDLVDQRVVNAVAAKEWCDQLALKWMKTSAKNDVNVESMFVDFSSMVLSGLPRNLCGLGAFEAVLRLQTFADQYECVGVLNLSFNQLREVPREVTRFVNLRELDLTRNELRDIPISLFRLQVVMCYCCVSVMSCP